MNRRGKLFALILVFLLAQAFIQAKVLFPIWQENYSNEAGGEVAAELSPDQILLQLFGFREFLAGILWIRGDGFFDEGNYDALLPIIRLCTELDPKEIDIYATGMWHIGYNFVDDQARSDRRYIPSAIALGKEGSKNNPDTYELFFETGWLWYQKVMDDPWQAVRWFQEAQRRPDMNDIPARKDILSNALQRNGQVDEALRVYYSLYADALKHAGEGGHDYSTNQIRDELENNIDTLIVRMVQRGWLAEERHDGSFATGDYDPNPPFDTGFSVKVTVPRARVLQLRGTWNVQPIGTRIRIVLRDADYPGAEYAQLDWNAAKTVNLDPPVDLTYMQDDLYVRNQSFNKEIDMSKDPTMYPCVKKEYILEFYYSPRLAPPHIQDKFSWNGEGMLDKNFSNTTIHGPMDFTYQPYPMSSDRGKTLPPVTLHSPGQRIMYARLTLTRDQLLRLGAWSAATPSVATKNYHEPKGDTNVSEIIKVPTLRGK